MINQNISIVTASFLISSSLWCLMNVKFVKRLKFLTFYSYENRKLCYTNTFFLKIDFDIISGIKCRLLQSDLCQFKSFIININDYQKYVGYIIFFFFSIGFHTSGIEKVVF